MQAVYTIYLPPRNHSSLIKKLFSSLIANIHKLVALWLILLIYFIINCSPQNNLLGKSTVTLVFSFTTFSQPPYSFFFFYLYTLNTRANKFILLLLKFRLYFISITHLFSISQEFHHKNKSIFHQFFLLKNNIIIGI